MKDPIRLLITVSAVIAIALVAAFFLSGPFLDEAEVSRLDSPSPAPSESLGGERDVSEANDISWAGPSEEPRLDQPREDDIAIPVDGDPLLVILAYFPELGQISIERYDKEGNPTGKPLKSGTIVQIPNPNIPGEKIQFTVP